MNFQVNEQFLKRCFQNYKLNFQQLESQLELDVGHVLLIRDCVVTWAEVDELILLVLLYVVHSINQGSICLTINDIEFNRFLSQHQSIESSADVLKVNWQNLTVDDQTVVYVEENRLYLNKYWQAERQLEKTLNVLLNNYSGLTLSSQQVNRAAHEVLSELTFEGIENKQFLAVVTSLLQPFSIISGGPGTGKTTIMSSVLRGLLISGYHVSDVVLAAPTGRAAQRMTESLHGVIQNSLKQLRDFDHELLQIEASTIHRLLGAHPHKGGFRYGQQHQLDAKIIIIDEVSMVDLMLMKQLIQAIPQDCRVLFLGDQFQLPSVSTGAVLADLLPPLKDSGAISQAMKSQLTEAMKGFNAAADILAGLTITKTPQTMTDRYTILEVSKRSNQHIAKISEIIKSGQAETLFAAGEWQKLTKASMQQYLSSDNEGVFQLPVFADQQHWVNFCTQWVKRQYFDGFSDFKTTVAALNRFNSSKITDYHDSLDYVFNCINSNRVLTLVNDSWIGCDFLNVQLAAMMRQNLEVSGFGHQYHGAVIMIKRNDKDLKLFNGDVGILLVDINKQLHLVVKNHDGYQVHAHHAIPEHSAAYAMTVHKSQGSEFAHVLIPLPLNTQHRMLSREIIYTGMTRAKKSVLIYGSEAVIQKAIETQTIRHSGLRFWYNQ